MRSTMTARPALYVALALGLSAMGCSKKKPSAANTEERQGEDAADAPSSTPSPRIRLREVILRVDDDDSAVNLYPKQLTRRLTKQLAQSSPFRADQAGESREADVQILVSHDIIDNDGQDEILAAVEARVVWVDDASAPVLSDRVLGAAPIRPEHRAELPERIAAHVAGTVDELGKGLIAMAELRHADAASLFAALVQDNPRITLYALERIGEVKPAEAVTAVAPLLSSDNPEIRGAAITALVAVGDPSAVHHLTRSADIGDSDAVVVIIEAVSVLGGKEAKQYLEFVSESHPDAAIKSHAQEALKRLQ